ncbi:MAG: hypothetical protein IJV51_01100, partial [Oscillospiraceae bacterium]|nr:hypothetical protein [Oscillospiraceae bacterium]
RGYIVQALRFRADEGVCPLGYIGPYGTSFTLQVLILPILLTKADTHIILYEKRYKLCADTIHDPHRACLCFERRKYGRAFFD